MAGSKRFSISRFFWNVTKVTGAYPCLLWFRRQAS